LSCFTFIRLTNIIINIFKLIINDIMQIKDVKSINTMLNIKNNLIQPVVELTPVNNKNKSRTEVSRETLTVIFLQHSVI